MNLWEIWMTRKSKIFGIRTRGSKKGQMVEIVGERDSSYIILSEDGWRYRTFINMGMENSANFYYDMDGEDRCLFVSKRVIDVPIFETKLGSLR